MGRDYTEIKNFNPQGSREPRRLEHVTEVTLTAISIHKALASLDLQKPYRLLWMIISIHKALASLDFTAPHRAKCSQISIHKALASLDVPRVVNWSKVTDFNPQGSREPRQLFEWHVLLEEHFNPQGSREPRLFKPVNNTVSGIISIHKALASLDVIVLNFNLNSFISIHKALASLDDSRNLSHLYVQISIHKALASLDDGIYFVTQASHNFNPQGSREPRRQKCTIILASMPHLHASYYTSSTNRFSS